MDSIVTEYTLDPVHRLRRLRRTPALRRIVRETALGPEPFVYPIFVRAGANVREPIEAMPGQFRYSVDALPMVADELQDARIGAALLFGLPDTKDERGSSAACEDGVV